MSTILIRTSKAHPSHRTPAGASYPHATRYPNRPWEEPQRDVPGSLFFGALTLIALIGLIVFGLLG